MSDAPLTIGGWTPRNVAGKHHGSAAAGLGIGRGWSAGWVVPTAPGPDAGDRIR